MRGAVETIVEDDEEGEISAGEDEGGRECTLDDN